MNHAETVCSNCGLPKTHTKEKIMGQDTQGLICINCIHIKWWSDFQTKADNND